MTLQHGVKIFQDYYKYHFMGQTIPLCYYSGGKGYLPILHTSCKRFEKDFTDTPTHYHYNNTLYRRTL